MAETFPGCKRTSKGTRFRGITIAMADVNDFREDMKKAMPDVCADLNDRIFNAPTQWQVLGHDAGAYDDPGNFRLDRGRITRP
jgi:hypothetical protein